MATTPPAPPAKRKRTTYACEACHSRKAKCDGERPVCGRCKSQSKSCVYRQQASAGSKQKQRRLVAAIPTPSSTEDEPQKSPTPSSPHQPPPSAITGTPVDYANFNPSASTHHSAPRPQTRQSERPHTSGFPDAHARVANHQQFTSRVTTALERTDHSLKIPRSHLIPFVDAPLFGHVDLSTASPHDDDNLQVPIFPHARELMDIYWLEIDPIEPVLDLENIDDLLLTAYRGPRLTFETINPVLLSTLNVVFALALQRKENIAEGLRNADTAVFFRRAWALLRPEIVLWQPPSLKVIQCLMLMNRFLHCTNDSYKTIMTANLAIQMAQQLCSKQVGKGEDRMSDRLRRLEQKVWLSCSGMQRCVDWSMGQSLTPVFNPPIDKTIPEPINAFRSHFKYFAAELQEIGTRTQLAQAQARCRQPPLTPLPRLHQDLTYETVALQLDNHLVDLERRFEELGDSTAEIRAHDLRVQMDYDMLYLRYLHARIYLCRPILAKLFCRNLPTLSNHNPTPTHLLTTSDRLLLDLAQSCITSARSVFAHIDRTMRMPNRFNPRDPNAPIIGHFPWWHRIYYLHIAATIFLAAMAVPSLYNADVSRYWHLTLDALRAHTHLCSWVPECVHMLETLAARILEARCLVRKTGEKDGDERGSASVASSSWAATSLLMGGAAAGGSAYGSGWDGEVDARFWEDCFDLDGLLFGTDLSGKTLQAV